MTVDPTTRSLIGGGTPTTQETTRVLSSSVQGYGSQDTLQAHTGLREEGFSLAMKEAQPDFHRAVVQSLESPQPPFVAQIAQPVVDAKETLVNRFFQQLSEESAATPQIHQEAKGKWSSYSADGEEAVTVAVDPFQGLHVDLVKPLSQRKVTLLQGALKELVTTAKTEKLFDSIWVNFAKPFSPAAFSVLPEEFQVGSATSDLIEDHQLNKTRVWLWINEERKSAIPLGATHNVGGSALIVDRGNEDTVAKVLLIREKRFPDRWSLPGGSFDVADRLPQATALREAQEETGLQIEGEPEGSLIGLMQYPQYQFAPALNMVWHFAVDGASQKELNPCPYEVIEARWVDYTEITESTGTLRDGIKLRTGIKPWLEAALKGELGYAKIGQEPNGLQYYASKE